MAFLKSIVLVTLFQIIALQAYTQGKDCVFSSEAEGGCLVGLKFNYCITSSNIYASQELGKFDVYLHLKFTNKTESSLKFEIEMDGNVYYTSTLYPKGFTDACTDYCYHPLRLIVNLSESPSTKVIKVKKVKKGTLSHPWASGADGFGPTKYEDLTCVSTFYVNLPARPVATPKKEAEKKPEEKKKTNGSNDDDFWSGSGKGTEDKKKNSGNGNDDFWSGSGNGKEVETNKKNDDFWNGTVEEDLKANFKAKCSGSNKCGYVNDKGAVVIDYIYYATYDFKENFGRVKTKDGYGFVNNKGVLITKQGFYEARDFSNGMAAVKQNDKWGFVNNTGQVVVPCIYDEVEDFKGDVAFATKLDQKITKKLSADCESSILRTTYKIDLLLKTKNKINKSNNVLAKEKIYTLQPEARTGIYLTTGGDIDRSWHEDAIKKCKEEERIANENLKSQAEGLGYKLQEKK